MVQTAKRQRIKSRLVQLKILADSLGYELIDNYKHPDYIERKGKVLALKNKRSNLVVCIYSTYAQIHSFLVDHAE